MFIQIYKHSLETYQTLINQTYKDEEHFTHFAM